MADGENGIDEHRLIVFVHPHLRTKAKQVGSSKVTKGHGNQGARPEAKQVQAFSRGKAHAVSYVQSMLTLHVGEDRAC